MNKNVKSSVDKLINTGFFHIFSSSVINKIIGFASSIVLVRILSKTDYGTYTYAYNIVSLILIMSGLGIPSGLLQILCEAQKDKDRVYATYAYGCRIALLFNSVLAILILLIGEFAPLKIEESRQILMLLCFLPICETVFSLQTAYMRSLLMTKQYSYTNNINTLLVFFGSVIGALYGNAKGMIIGRYVAYIFSAILVTALFKLPVHRGKIDVANVRRKELFNISIVSAANNGISQLLYLLDVFIIGIIVADQSVIASYKVATTIPTALTFIPAAAITYVYPYFAHHREDKAWVKSHYIKLISIMGIVNILISFLLIVFAPIIVRLCFGAKYLDCVTIFRILAVNYFISGTFRIISGNLLVTQRQLRFNLFVAIASGIVNIIGNIILVSKYGAIGATITTVLVVIFSSIASTWKFYKIVNDNGERSSCI